MKKDLGEILVVLVGTVVLDFIEQKEGFSCQIVFLILMQKV